MSINLPAYKLIIFDWDGTLMDSVSKIVACMQAASKDAGVVVPSDAAVRDIIGLGLSDAIDQLHPNIHNKHLALIEDRYRHHFVDQDNTASPLFPGASQVLNTLIGQGYTLGIATGKGRKGLDRILSELDMHGLFAISRCADETDPKPHPAMVKEILKETGIRANQALVVGDTEYDMAMAQSAMVDRVAVSYGAHHIDRLKPYSPVLMIDGIEEILPWLEKMGL